ncbi:MAG: hypothetical protein Q8N48_13085 [Thiobacillus sp.]|nr:hypothetical protein [Thiobacillus sp.]MDP2979748.1 hypothetical protein [Thiobacillus sp.]
MNLLKSTRWAAIALGLLGASSNALACVVTPDSILTEGQTLQLVADCGAEKIVKINWQIAPASDTPGTPGTFATLTGDVDLDQPVAKKVYYTIPAELSSSGAGEYWFKVTGTKVGAESGTTEPLTTSDMAKVVIKPAANAVLSVANVKNPAVPGNCGTPQGAAIQSMPTGLAQCNPGKPALAISGPQSFTWSCLGVNGGAEANCYALRGYTVSATVGANGSLVGISPAGGGVAAGGTATITVNPEPNFSASYSSPCGGTPAGNSFTTGPVNSNCNVTVSFSNTPVYGACGTASNSTPVESKPNANLCTLTGGTPTSVVDTAVANKWTWGCNGTPNGSSTTATDCQAPKGYLVTTSGSGANGTIAASKVVAGGTTTTFTVTPVSGYAATVSGCGGSLSGNTYTTGAISSACTVSATFAVQTVSTTDPGIGAGLWVPPNMPNRTVADQSSSGMSLSYVPGCLNGQFAKDSSSACAVNAYYTGSIAGTTTSQTVTMGSGKQLVLRYKTPATITDAKTIKVSAWNGGNVAVNMKTWLSTSPTASYETVPTECRALSTTSPMISTASRESITTTTTGWFTSTTTRYYCQLAPNTVYYFGIEFPEVVSGSAARFQVDELSADFLP